MPDTVSPPVRDRAGFTLLEMLIYVTVLGTLMAIALPRLNSLTKQRRLIAASFVASADVEASFALAARQRRPVRIAYDAASGELRSTDRKSGTLYRRRALGTTSEFSLDSVRITPAVVDVYPNGLASAPFTILLKMSTNTRQVVVTRTGLTRLVVP